MEVCSSFRRLCSTLIGMLGTGAGTLTLDRLRRACPEVRPSDRVRSAETFLRSPVLVPHCALVRFAPHFAKQKR